ncbi:unnamed protein product, partial [Discosporangium mesarthrocarpum]
FLQLTRDWGISSHNTGQMRLYASADSLYAGDEHDRRSVSGGAPMFSGSAVALFCRTQQVVALFSTEAEFMAMVEFVKELPFFKNVLRFVQPLSGVEDNTIWVYKDNMGAINLAENPSSSGRSKHID